MKKKIFIVVLVIIILIAIGCIIKINYTKNILNKIGDIYTRLIEDKNIYYESIRTENNEFTYKMWVKNSKTVAINNGLKYYADFENKEYYQQQENELIKVEDVPILLKNGRALVNSPGVLVDGQEVDKLSFKNLLIDINIMIENYNGIECYKIFYGDEITYCDKETLSLIKTITYNEGEVFEVNTYNISFDTVTDEDVDLEKFKEI